MFFLLGLFFAGVVAREVFNGVVLVRLKEKRHLDFFVAAYVASEYRFSAVVFAFFALFGIFSGLAAFLTPFWYDGLFFFPLLGLVVGYLAGVSTNLKNSKKLVSRLDLAFPFSNVLTVTFKKGARESLFVLACDTLAVVGVIAFTYFAVSSSFPGWI